MVFLYWMAFFIGLFTGVVVIVVFRMITTKKGTLLVDHSNPKKDVYRILLNGVVKETTRTFVLKVKHDADLSQD